MLRLACHIKKHFHTFSRIIEKPAVLWYEALFLMMNAVIVALTIIIPKTHPLQYILCVLMYVFIGLFFIETLLRLIAKKKNFFRDSLNLVNLIVVISALAFQIPTLSLILTFRSFRAFRLIKNIPKTEHIMGMLFHSIPGAINLFVLILFAYLIFGLLGTSLFGEKVPQLWGNFHTSIITLEQIMIQSDWGHNVRATTQYYPYANVFFVSFLLLVGYILLNLFVGIIVDAMQSSKPYEEKKEVPDQTKKELIILTEKIVKEVKNLQKIAEEYNSK